MNAKEIEEKRKQHFISEVQKEIDENLYKSFKKEIDVYFPNDLYGYIKSYLDDKGFTIYRPCNENENMFLISL